MKRRVLPIVLAVVLTLVILPVWLHYHAVQCEQASSRLITSLKNHDIPAALVALREGADPNTRNGIDEKATDAKHFSVIDQIKQYWSQLFHPVKREADTSLTALLLALNPVKPDRMNLVKSLLDAGANTNLTGGATRVSPLMVAANAESSQIFHLLLMHGADVRQKDDFDATPLHYAVNSGTTEMVERLLAAGADIEAKDKDGQTPLRSACTVGNLAIIQTLIRHHANVNARNKRGETALSNSRERVNPEVYACLIDSGANKPSKDTGH